MTVEQGGKAILTIPVEVHRMNDEIALVYIPSLDFSLGQVPVSLLSDDAVQPVTPDRAFRERVESIVNHHVRSVQPRNWGLTTAIVDALLASGVLGQSQPQPDRADIKDLIDDLRESAAQSYDELSQVTIDTLNRAIDALLPLLGQPQPQPDREALRRTVALAIHAAGCGCADYTGPGDDDEQYETLADAALDALLPLLGQPRTDAPKPDTVNVGGLHVAPEMEAMLRASLDIHGVKQPPRTDAPLDPEAEDPK